LHPLGGISLSGKALKWEFGDSVYAGKSEAVPAAVSPGEPF